MLHFARVFFVIFLLVVSFSKLPGQLDSLARVWEQMPATAASVDSGNTWLKAYTADDPEQALQMARANLRRARRIDYAFGTTEAIARIGWAHDFAYGFDSAFFYYNKAGQEHAARTRYAEAFDNFHNAGLSRYLADEYVVALKFLERARTYADSIADSSRIARVLSNIGKVYNKLALREAAEKYYLESLAIREALNDEKGMLFNLENLVNLYFMMERFPEAKPYLDRAIAMVEARKDTLLLSSFITKRGRWLIQEEAWPEAIAVFEESLEMGAPYPEHETQPDVSNYWIAVAWQAQGDFDKACAYATIALDAALRTNRKNSEQHIRKLLAECYEDRGMTEAALENQKIVFALEVEIMTDRVADLTAEHAVKYRLDSIRNAEIARTALETERRENQERISNGLKIVLLVVGGLLLLAVFLWVGNLRARKKIETQKGLLERSLEEKEVLMREIHHRVKNNLQSIVSMLQLQKRRSDNAEVRESLNQSLVRITTLSRLHGILYRQDDLSRIDGSAYIRDVTDKVLQAFDARATLQVELEGLALDQDQLLFFGFIVNEWLTNALKHSEAPEGLQLHIARRPTGKFPNRIVMSDNGQGYDPESIQRGFGLNMMASLATRMGGELNYEAATNTTVLAI